MVDEETQNKYDEDNELSEDQLNSQEIHLDPETLVVQCLFKMQTALMNPDMKAGFIQFRMLAEHAEMLMRAMNRLDSDYDQKVAAYIQTEDYLGKDGVTGMDDVSRSTRLANFKAGVLLAGYLKYRSTTAPLELK